MAETAGICSGGSDHPSTHRCDRDKGQDPWTGRAAVDERPKPHRPVARCRLRSSRKDPNYLGPCRLCALLPWT
ncbi:MAG: hypothetical protein ACLTSX_06710 [Collinsella sp.]